jgi:L-ascorbate metabolism protein UlaG (beta-lactamase superfamily)
MLALKSKKSLLYCHYLFVVYFPSSSNFKEGLVMKNLLYFIIIIISVSTIGCGNEEETKNTAPIISSFQANPASVSTNGQVTLTVSAIDAENDDLTYSYQSSDGNITGTGNTVTWVAPSTPGSYTINVIASDGKLNAQSSVGVSVVAPPIPPEKTKELKVQWFGQSCFLITSSDGKRVLTDPYSSGIGYTVPSLEADVVTVSHVHSDHNNVSMAKGSPEVVRNLGETTASGLSFLGVQSDHDANGGSQRGKNTIFVWKMDDMRLAHLGDLGTVLTDDQMKEMGKIDILLIPVGSVYTINANQATKVVEQLSPKIVFPMHYKTDVLNIGLAGVDDFLAGKDNVEKVNGNTFVVKELPDKTKIVVLNYK